MLLMEREDVITQFKQGAAAVARSGKVILLNGEAGIGKTSILEHIRIELKNEYTFLWSGCDPLLTPQPYAPFKDIAEQLSPTLLPLFESGSSPSKINNALYKALELRTSPCIFIIEDIHWADNATLDLLKFIVRRISFIPCLLCVSYRSDELANNPSLSSMLSLIPSAHVIRAALSPLSLSAVEQLTKNTKHDPQKLHEVSAGNPFFVSELLNSDDISNENIPVSVRDSVNARVANLAEHERAFLSTLSLIPYAFRLELIEYLFGDGANNIVMKCESRKLLQCNVKGDYRFRHELTRLAIQSTLSMHVKKTEHARILDALINLGLSNNLAWAVHHAQGARDAQLVLKYASQAAKYSADLGAHKEAASYYDKALTFVEHADAELAAILHEQWAYEVGLTMRMDQSVVDARRHAISIWRALNRQDKVAENLRWLSRLHWYRGEAERAEHFANEAIKHFESIAASSELAMAYSMRSQLDMLNDRNNDAIMWGNKALELEKTFPNPAVRAHALNNIGSALLLHGNESGKHYLEQSLEVAQANGLHEDVARVYTNYSDYCVRFKKLEQAETLITKGIQYDVAHDLDSWTYYLVGIQAQLRQEQGRLVDAQTIAAGVQDLDNQTMLMKLPALIVLSKVNSRLGCEDASVQLTKALEHAISIDEYQYTVQAHLNFIEHFWLTEKSLKPALSRAEPHFTYLQALPSGALNTWQIGELQVWYCRFGIAIPYCEEDDIAQPWRLELNGQLDKAYQKWLALNMPFNAAMCLLQSQGRPEGPSQINNQAQNLQKAYSEFEALHAQGAIKRLLNIAKQNGVNIHINKPRRGPYAKTKQHPLGLTAKEQQVLSLLVKGSSNADIAAHLSRSTRTIENHVASILQKLNATNRMDAILRVQNEPWLSAG